jgi:DNA mismatch repair protein MutS
MVPAPQLGLFGTPVHPAIERLQAMDPERMTPIEALAALDEVVRLAREAEVQS